MKHHLEHLYKLGFPQYAFSDEELLELQKFSFRYFLDLRKTINSALSPDMGPTPQDSFIEELKWKYLLSIYLQTFDASNYSLDLTNKRAAVAETKFFITVEYLSPDPIIQVNAFSQGMESFSQSYLASRRFSLYFEDTSTNAERIKAISLHPINLELIYEYYWDIEGPEVKTFAEMEKWKKEIGDIGSRVRYLAGDVL